MNDEIYGTIELISEVLKQAFVDYVSALRLIDIFNSIPFPRDDVNDRTRIRQNNIKLVDVWDSLEWFDSRGEEPMSYVWCCEAVGLDHRVIPAIFDNMQLTRSGERELFETYVRPLMSRMSSSSNSVNVPEEYFS